MPVKWKAASRFKPRFVLEKINSVRTVKPEGGVAYADFVIHDYLSVLQSMLEFPPSADNVDTSTLVWTALGKVRDSLTQDNLLEAVNRELNDHLATRESRYFLVTSVSLDLTGLAQSFRAFGVYVRHLKKSKSTYLKAHARILSQHKVAIEPTPAHYQRLIAEVKAKSPSAAFLKGMQAIDLQRALWCLMGNKTIEISFGTPSFQPINVVRLGGLHTLHKPGGDPAFEGLWFESNFVPAKSHQFNEPAIVARNARWALRRIQNSKYGPRIAAALVRFVRALDQSDPDSAFVRLWGALETLVTPDVADYDALVRRCTFLFRDGTYHRQVLEHLREYRNQHLHGGFESAHAKIHCYQLQMYFVQTAWFFIRNTTRFASIREANEFLDHSADASILKKKLSNTKMALRFVS